MSESDTLYVASVDGDDDTESDGMGAAARATLVQRASRAGEVSWSAISTGLGKIATPDVDGKTAAWLSASLGVQLVLVLVRLYSRANPSPGDQTCEPMPGMDDANKPVQNTTLQNTCDILLWVIAITRNVWVIRYAAATHPVEMRAAFKIPSLAYHSLLGNSSVLVLELLAYSLIGFFFKIMAFSSDDGVETCSSPGGTWQTYCDSADLSSNDPCIDQQRCWEAGSAKITHIGGDTDSVCVYASANELHLSNYILFVLQAINYPSMFLLFTALDNSFLRIKFVSLTLQLFMLLMLIDSLALHLIYIVDVANFSPKFQSMRILSLGSFIIMRLTAYRFVAFKRDMPCKAFCKEVRHDVEGLRFVPDEARARLESEADNEAIAFGGA